MVCASRQNPAWLCAAIAPDLDILEHLTYVSPAERGPVSALGVVSLGRAPLSPMCRQHDDTHGGGGALLHAGRGPAATFSRWERQPHPASGAAALLPSLVREGLGVRSTGRTAEGSGEHEGSERGGQGNGGGRGDARRVRADRAVDEERREIELCATSEAG